MIIALLALNSTAQDILYDNYVYVTNIRSVKFHPVNQPLEPPVAFVNNSDRLVLSFDDVSGDTKDYQYKIIHCDYQWEPSGMEDIEYLEGFLDGEIRNPIFSVNTWVSYTSYNLVLPNRNFRWTKSGNYILLIYEDDPSLPVITRRFTVVDSKVFVKAEARRAIEVSKMYTDQVFDISINTNEYRIVNPMTNIYVSITQNNRWDNALIGLQPLFTQGNEIVIDNRGKINFPAYKEFRELDIRSLDFGNETIEKIDLNEDGTDVYVFPDYPRPTRNYLTRLDANGQYVIDNKDGELQSADYADVIFTLKSPEYLEDVYVAGDFTDYKADEMYKMEYDPNEEAYILSIPLKQGYYNYMYGVKKKDGMDYTELEGSNADAENSYQVYVYLKEPGARYDRLIGFSSFKSNDFRR